MKPPFASATTPPPSVQPTWVGRHAQPKDELKPGYLVEFHIKEVDKKSRRLKVELSQIPAVAGAHDDAQRQDRRDCHDDRRLRFL